MCHRRRRRRRRRRRATVGGWQQRQQTHYYVLLLPADTTNSTTTTTSHHHTFLYEQTATTKHNKNTIKQQQHHQKMGILWTRRGGGGEEQEQAVQQATSTMIMISRNILGAIEITFTSSIMLYSLLITALIADISNAAKVIDNGAERLTPIADSAFSAGRLRRDGQRQRAAFDLVRLEHQMAFTVHTAHLPADSRQSLKDEPNGPSPSRREMIEDGPSATDAESSPPVDGCRQHCDDQLHMGLDMVKAHSAFGSIGVPSVLDALDLEMFCRVDAEHDACLLGCGYQVQYNMRDFVCKRKRKELISHLNCYKNAAPLLRRQCGAARCGPYQELEHSLLGVSQRCRTLLCDTQCLRTQLAQSNACREGGRPALQYLITYSQVQVLAWLRDLLEGGTSSTRPGSRFWRAMPRSCLRLICGPTGSAQNCTLPTV